MVQFIREIVWPELVLADATGPASGGSVSPTSESRDISNTPKRCRQSLSRQHSLVRIGCPNPSVASYASHPSKFPDRPVLTRVASS